MSNPYTTTPVGASYNVSPPSDDAQAVAANQVFWAKHIDKIGDPIKTAHDTSETNTSTAFAGLDLNLKRAITVNDTQLAADERKLISATNTITYTLLLAVTAGDGFTVTVLNDGTGIVTIDANASELIAGQLTRTLNPGDAVKLRCNAVGWDIAAKFDKQFVLRDGSELTISAGSITPTTNYHTVDTEADAATDDLTDIVTTNIPDGGLLVVKPIVATRTVVVKHTASGANKIVLVDGIDITLDDVSQSVTLQRRGDHWEELSRAAALAPGRLIGVQTFTATGTWTPTAGTKDVVVEVRGGGGGGGRGINVAGGGGGGGGGQGGRTTERILAAALGATEAVTVGTGGAGATVDNGGAGLTSSFGGPVLAQATGGGGGLEGINSGPGGRAGNGGVGSLGDINFTGQGGQNGDTGNGSTVDGNGGAGGGEGGGRGGATGGTSGVAGADGGGGGGGIADLPGPGGAGGAGYVIVYEYS